MKTLAGIMTVAVMACFIGGCAEMSTLTGSDTSVENQVVVPPVGNFNDRMNNLADQLDKNVAANSLSNTYIVTSFTNLDKLDDTNALGRLVSENIMHGLQLHKWQILEVRLTKGIDINPAGEFSLSRDINKLREEYKISGVITGTYSIAEGNLTINARVIDINTGIVISSAQTYIPVSWLPAAPLQNENNGKPMKIVSDGIK